MSHDRSMIELPRIEIGSWPTPVRRLPRVSELLGRDVWVKVEEDCGAWGGNKVRKLEYILAAARAEDRSTLVSYGAGTSNWATALAHHGPSLGFDVVAGLAGRIPPEYSKVYSSPRVRVVASPMVNALPAVVLVARVTAGPRALSIPMGGSGYGDIGCVHTGHEIVDSVARREMPRPEAVFVAVGTAGTAAGTAVGLAVRGLKVPVVGVRVAPWPFGSARRVRSHAVRLLDRLAYDAPVLVEGDDRFFKPGYARPNEASREAIALAAEDGITLDGTYAAKAFASLVARARSSAGPPLLFIHTSPGSPPP